MSDVMRLLEMYGQLSEERNIYDSSVGPDGHLYVELFEDITKRRIEARMSETKKFQDAYLRRGKLDLTVLDKPQTGIYENGAENRQQGTAFFDLERGTPVESEADNDHYDMNNTNRVVTENMLNNSEKTDDWQARCKYLEPKYSLLRKL